jgi:hypothetical protein
MVRQIASAILATTLLLIITPGAGAQTGTAGGPKTGTGGTATSGTGVKTGQGPLTGRIPPAASTTNPQNNPQRPQNMQGGAVQTKPPANPFGK